MKIINNNEYKIMYGVEFINSKEVKEIEDKEIVKLLLSQPNVEEFVDKADLKKVEEENKKLKEELKEVKKDMDCGITLENCQDYKENDIIEIYELVEIKR